MTNHASQEPFFENLGLYFETNHLEHADELKQFATTLFNLAPVKELDDQPLEDVAGMVMSLRRYLDQFDGLSPKVRSFNPNLEEDGWEHPYTQVFILQHDMAFLVDSVRMAFSRNGLGVHAINSTILHVVRDEHGQLTALLPKPSDESRPETLLFFQVDHYYSEEEHSRILAEIRNVLGCVEVVNKAYIPCMDKLDQVIESIGKLSNYSSDVIQEENIDFLRWLRDNHFTFLAYSYYALSNEHDPLISYVPEQSLGLFQYRPKTIASARLSTLAPGFKTFHDGDDILTLAKSSVRSRVHRDAYCDYVVVKDFDDAGRVVGEHRFLGLYTSLVYSQSPFYVPLIRQKLHRIYDRSGLDPRGHYGKALRQIIESHPREELFHGSEDQLYDILLGIWQINERRQVRLFVRTDPFNKFVNCIVFFPRDSYRTEIREKAEQLLCKAFSAIESQFGTFFSQSLLARTHFVLRIDSDEYQSVNVGELEKQIAAFTNDWRDDLQQTIIEHWGDEQGIERAEIYRNAFPVSYQSHFDPRSAVHDIALFESLSDEEEIATSFFQPLEAEKRVFRFKIFHPGSELSLSRMVPMLENLGFQVIGEHPYQLKPSGRKTVWVHDFSLEFSLDLDIDISGVRQNFMDAFKAVWRAQVDDDSFNWLVIGARLDWRAVALIRVYARYMKQLGISISQEFIARTLCDNLDITRDLVALFKTRFDPKLAAAKDPESDRPQRLRQKIIGALDKVKNLNQDAVLRMYAELICATVRTNFFQHNGKRLEKDYIAIKLMPRALPSVPQPRPEFEVFVYSSRFEGVHLRAGKIARGGIRWSDRLEDYRTEVLGLVKAQQVKNAVIVPTGAKGGFIAKKIGPQDSRSDRLSEGEACYSLFVQGLLDVTDNVVDGEIIPPREVVRHDEDDAYLVVAADKGTASFSDLANGVSENYGHWLGDAFASGGTNGYDHKKMGITAKGAWVAVQRHFRELGINTQTDEFTVMGIGDMSGDVFGNGMLLSSQIRLVAAFNHEAIFIDPDPDTEQSFSERQRLFSLPASGWTDYDESKISTGGGVFSRAAKAIVITPQMGDLFDIGEAELTPDQLIKYLLKSRVDLIWNGGIGTYVKAASESNIDVGDRNNDNLRIDGNQLRCRVFGEGGNLGITQRGRVEYCLSGGACNTDFIDNAGGVDCSDQEVNIKIALNQLVAAEDLTRKQRNQLLHEMTGDVETRVLRHNYRQTLAISLARLRSTQNLSEFWQCITDWESRGLLDRQLEYLPDDESLTEREKNGQYLSRPELSVLLSYGKILFKHQLLDTGIDTDDVVQKEIFKAFPAAIAEKFPEAINNHALKKEVICNQLANEIIDVMGLSFVHRQMKSTGAGADDIVRAYLTVRDVLKLDEVWQEVEKLDYQHSADVQYELLTSLMRLGRRTSRWVIRNRRSCVNTQAEINTLKPILGYLLSASIEQYDAFRHQHDSKIDDLRALGLSPYAAMLIDSASDLFFAFGMADVSIRAGVDMKQVSEVYSELGELLHLEWFSQQIIELPSENRWEDFAREAFIDELEGHYRTLAVTMLDSLETPEELGVRLQNWQASQSVLVNRWQNMIVELKGTTVRKYAMFSVALRELEDLVDTTLQQGSLADFCALPQAAEPE